MLWAFVCVPLVILLGVNIGAALWWRRRRELMESGVPVTGQVVKVNITVTERVDPNTRMVLSSSTSMRPVVRFTTQTGEPISTSPMRSGIEKFLVPGDDVKIRYSARNPMRCVVDQRGATQGTAAMLAGLVAVNLFLVGFASVAGFLVGHRMSVQPNKPPAAALVLGQPFGPATAGGTASSTSQGSATSTGAWSAADGALTVSVVKVVNTGGTISLALSAHNGANASVTLPIYGDFAATDDQGNSYTAHPLTPVTVQAGATFSGTVTLDQAVPASARSLNVTWAHVFSQDPTLNGSITITGVVLPH